MPEPDGRCLAAALCRLLGFTIAAVELGEGWLLMFELRKEVSWADKLFVREVAHAGKQIRVVGC